MKAIKAAMPYESSVQYSTIFNRDWKRIKYIHIHFTRYFSFIRIYLSIQFSFLINRDYVLNEKLIIIRSLLTKLTKYKLIERFSKKEKVL